MIYKCIVLNINMSLLEKYTQNDLNKIIGNGKSINYIIDWISNFNLVRTFLKKHKLLKKSTKGRKKKIDGLSEIETEYMKMKSCLVVTGPHGCGKSTIIDILLKDYNIINLNELSSHTLIDSKLILNIHINSQDNKNIILVDDWESITTSCNKRGITEIIKDNNFNRWMPMVIITNNKHDKQISNIKKCSNEIKIYHPFSSEIIRWIYNICKQENINIKYDLISDINNHCQNDLRRILIFLNELNVNYKNIYIDEKILDIIKKSLGKTNQSLDLFKATEYLLTDYNNLNNCIEMYKIDKTVIPLMIFENYHKYTGHSHIIMDKISLSDIFEYYIFCEQNWDLLEVYGLISCGIPSYFVNKFTNGKTNQKLIYATDLNKASVMKMNKKNKSNISDKKVSKNEIFNYKKENTKKKREEVTKLFIEKQKNNNKTITDFMYINDIVDKLFSK